MLLLSSKYLYLAIFSFVFALVCFSIEFSSLSVIFECLSRHFSSTFSQFSSTFRIFLNFQSPLLLSVTSLTFQSYFLLFFAYFSANPPVSLIFYFILLFTNFQSVLFLTFSANSKKSSHLNEKFIRMKYGYIAIHEPIAMYQRKCCGL